MGHDRPASWVLWAGDRDLYTCIVIQCTLYNEFFFTKCLGIVCVGNRDLSEKSAKISFNIILLNLAGRIIAIFLLIDLFVFSS